MMRRFSDVAAEDGIGFDGVVHADMDDLLRMRCDLDGLARFVRHLAEHLAEACRLRLEQLAVAV